MPHNGLPSALRRGSFNRVKSRLIPITIVLLVTGFISGVAWGAAPSGAELASACTACHGDAGRSHGAIPSLAGMDPDAFHDRMTAFQHGKGSLMNRIAPGYDDDEIATLGHYFAAQTTADADDPAKQ